MKKLEYEPSDSMQTYLWALVLPLMLSLIISLFLQGSETITTPEGKEIFAVTEKVWFVCVLRACTALLLVGLFFVYSKTKNVQALKASGLTQKSNYLNIAICAVLGIGICYLCSPIISLLSNLFSQIGIPVQTEIDIPLSSFGYYALAVLMIGILPAITEELVFRGIIFNGLKKCGKWTAILLSAVMFSLMHANVPQFPFTFILGVVLGLVMWETGALWLCMILHFFNNFTVLTSMYISAITGGGESVTNISVVTVLLSILMFALAILLVYLAIFLIKKIGKKSECAPNAETITPKKSIFGFREIVFLSLGIGVAVGLTIIKTI